MNTRIIWRVVKVAMEPIGGLIDESVGLGARVVAIATDNVDDADDWSDMARGSSKKIRKGVAAMVGLAGIGGDEENGSDNGE